MSEDYSTEDIELAKQNKNLVNMICKRCDDEKIEYINNSDEEDFGIVDVDLSIFLPSGRSKREVVLWDIDELIEFNNMEFEKYSFIGNYAAICRYDKNIIEAVFSTLSDDTLTHIRKKKLLKAFGIEFNNDLDFKPHELISSDIDQKTKIFITPITDQLKALTGQSSENDICIMIVSKISTHFEALKILEKVCHSVFFEIDIKNNISPSLIRERKYNFRGKRLNEISSAKYPKYEYNSSPISLYWYARSAINMPLLQFLAYYQTVEYFYPIYFKTEINKKVRSIIKDPLFEVESEVDISKITFALNSKSGGYGNEKDQLKATLRECVNQNQLDEFLREDEKRQEFFSSKQKGLSQHTINLANKGNDLVNQVGDRVYDIRCKVVHVKLEDGDPEVELLLPYTEEAEKLTYDIELVQFLAQKVLIFSSTPIKL